QSYTVDIENGNQPVVDFVNMQSTELTIVAGTLTPGTTYNYAITANCQASNVSSAIGQIEGADIQDRQPTISITNVNNPVCPDDDFSGSFGVTVNDQCGASYDVSVGSATFFNVPAGATVTFGSLNAGAAPSGTTYTVNLALAAAGGCQFNTDATGCVSSVSATQTLVASDAVDPTMDVTAAGGVAVGTGASFTYTPPEGECGVQILWSVFPFDNCSSPSEIDFTASITNPNLGVFPTAQITQDAVDAAYAVNMFAAVGTNTVTLSATDENGNNTTITYTIEVVDSRLPEIYGPGDMQVEIPACQDTGVPVNWTVSTVDDCDIQPTLVQTAGPTSGSTLAAGSYTVSYTSTDDYGNVASYSFDITVTQAASPAPIVDVSGNGQFNVPACEASALVVFSGNVYDCDVDLFNYNPADLTVITTPLSAGASGSVAISYDLAQEDAVYFEATGFLTPGTYLIVTTYQGVSVDHGVVVTQDANQPAEITLPGNLAFLEPLCADGASVNFQVQITDDCDADLSGATFTLNGVAAPAIDAVASNPSAGLYVWNLADVPAGFYTLAATYVDGAGATSESSATITVTDQPDNSAPII
ncbi:MAG: HYR domain-containing protein, partial [Phaeodactylibacter sp.]|nr:HYR domain-containing protein [Phaeodactylibacter sp.]